MSICVLTIILLITHSNIGNCDDRKLPLPPFGRQMRKEFFMKDDFILLSHGSFGTYPLTVSRAIHAYQKQSEQNPDLWLRRDVWTALDSVLEMLATLISADSKDIVMVPNTTSGMNAIFRSLVFSAGERILHLSTIYGSMGSLIQYVVDSSNGVVSKLVFNVTFPVTNKEFLEKFETFLDENHDPRSMIRIALIDHITSKPAVINPIAEIIPMLKRRNIEVLIDGAHALGQVQINITEFAPDYYVADCHKWLYAARGCGLLYVDKKRQSSIHPADINAAYKQPSDFKNEFMGTANGAMDYSMYLTVPTALQFRRDAGGEQAIMQYNHQLACEGGNRMAARFRTEVLQQPDQIGNMIDVRLPIEDLDNPKLSIPRWWIDIQLDKYPGTFTPVYKHNDALWTRVSAQIYNDLSDFDYLADHFLRIIRDELSPQRNSTVMIANIRIE